MTNIYCATGHRPQHLFKDGAFSLKDYHKLIELAQGFITDLEISPDLVWCGGALGWDMAVQQACIDLGIPYNLAAPCYNQEAKWPDYWQKRYQVYIKSANEVIYVREGDYNGPQCMTDRDYYMLDKCNIGAIALWNPSKRTGGTYKTVQCAQKSRKPVHNAWSDWVKE